jgi:hypothetical protein
MYDERTRRDKTFFQVMEINDHYGSRKMTLVQKAISASCVIEELVQRCRSTPNERGQDFCDTSERRRR